MSSAPKTKGELGIVGGQTIQSPAPARPLPEVNFSWSPLSVPQTLVINGNTYPRAANVPIAGSPAQPELRVTTSHTELTFTANVRVPEGDFITEYEWDFGDGFKGYGAVVKHTYISSSPSTRTVLCVTDNRGRRICRGKNMRLKAAQLTVVGGMGGPG